jgi:PAS domain S-box-containing protein
VGLKTLTSAVPEQGARPRPDWLAPDGEMSALIAQLTDETCPLGPADTWPDALRIAVNLMLGSRFPMFVAWGEHLPYLYNDACIPIVGERHPEALGRPFRDIWPDVWADLSPLLDQALSGQTVYAEDLPLQLKRNGRVEDASFTFSYSPVRDEAGVVRGVLSVAMETTEKVRSERRRDFLARLDARLRDVDDPDALVAAACELLGRELNVKRCGYTEVEPGEEYSIVRGGWAAEGASVLTGRHRLADWGGFLVSAWRSGDVTRFDDVLTDPRLEPEAAAMRAAARVRSSMTAPVLKAGRLVALFYVNHDAPRAWSEDEEAALKEVAERTWAAFEQARAQAETRERERELQVLTDALPVLISYVDRDQRYQFNNRAYEDWFGRSRESIKGRHLKDVLGEAAYESLRPHVERALAGESFGFEGRVPYKDGGARHVHADYVPRRSPSGEVEGYYALVQDVTARVEAEAALRESEERLRLAAEAAQIGTWDLDLRTGTGRWDEAATRMSGLGTDDTSYTSETWLRVVHPDDRAAALAAFEASLRPGGAAYDVEFRSAVPAADGGERWLVSHGAVMRDPATGEALRAVGIVRDVTERKRAERALRESEERYRLKLAELETVYASSPVGLAYFDVDLRYMRINERLAELNGLPVEAHIGRTIREIVPDIADAVGAIAEEVRRTGKGVYGREVCGETRAHPGETHFWLEHWTPLFGPEGEVVGFNAAVEDVTSLKHAEAALRRTAERMKAAERAVNAVIYDAEGGKVWRSDGLEQLLGWTHEDLGDGAGSWEALWHPDDVAKLKAFDPTRLPDGRYSIEYRVRRKDGRYVWVMDRGQSFLGPDGRVRLIGASFDIDERKTAEEHRELLIAELNHRVKNTLAIVQGLAERSFKDDASHAARATFEGRLMALSAAHDVLTRESWESADLGELARRTLAAHGDIGRFSVKGPPLRLGPKSAVTVSMALHELSTNAVKYGALSVPGGAVSIHWQVVSGDEPRLRLEWVESGGPAVAPPQRKGFGTRLIERSLASELKGQVRLEFRPTGLHCLVDAPVPGLA